MIVKNQIVMDMVNTVAQSSSVSLFNFQDLDITNSSSSSEYYTYNGDTPQSGSIPLPAGWMIKFNVVINGATTSISVGQASVTYTYLEVIEQLNTNTLGIVFYLNPNHNTSADWSVSVAATNYTVLGWGRKQSNLPLVFYHETFIQTTYTNLIPNSTVSASISGGYTYTELMSELMAHPYKFDTISIYTNTLSQVTKTLTLTSKENNGRKNVEFTFPVVDPLQKQFVKEDVPFGFVPNFGSSIDFTVDASESVRFIFSYKTIDYNNILQDPKKVDAELSKYSSKKKELEEALKPKKKESNDFIKKLFGWK